jgi:hypothetical protein
VAEHALAAQVTSADAHHGLHEARLPLSIAQLRHDVIGDTMLSFAKAERLGRYLAQ